MLEALNKQESGSYPRAAYSYLKERTDERHLCWLLTAAFVKSDNKSSDGSAEAPWEAGPRPRVWLDD